jgi:addiction module HigA family antidote
MAATHFLHPGEILKMDYLEGYNLSVAKAAAAMNMTRARLNEIVTGKRNITADTALRLARFFWGEAQFWLTLQTHYDLGQAEAVSAGRLAEIEPVSRLEAGSRTVF